MTALELGEKSVLFGRYLEYYIIVAIILAVNKAWFGVQKAGRNKKPGWSWHKRDWKETLEHVVPL